MLNNQTSEFIADINTQQEQIAPEFQIKPDRVFYSIDDFTVTQDTNVVEETDSTISKSVKTLKDIWGGELSTLIKNVSKRTLKEIRDIPVMTQVEYLREFKDSIVNKQQRNSKRVSLKFNYGFRYDSVIILDKYKDHYVLMIEAFKDNEFLGAYEYNLNLWLKQYEELMTNK